MTTTQDARRSPATRGNGGPLAGGSQALTSDQLTQAAAFAAIARGGMPLLPTFGAGPAAAGPGAATQALAWLAQAVPGMRCVCGHRTRSHYGREAECLCAGRFTRTCGCMTYRRQAGRLGRAGRWAGRKAAGLWRALPGPWWVKGPIMVACLLVPGPLDELAVIALAGFLAVRKARAAR